MTIRRTGGEQEIPDEQAWELINDLALYQTWKPFLDPVTDEPGRSKPGDDANTYRAVIIKLESGRAPRCLDRIGTLNPCEEDDDCLLGRREHDSTRNAVARALAPVTRALQRVRRSGATDAHREPPGRSGRYPDHHGPHGR